MMKILRENLITISVFIINMTMPFLLFSASDNTIQSLHEVPSRTAHLYSEMNATTRCGDNGRCGDDDDGRCGDDDDGRCGVRS